MFIRLIVFGFLALCVIYLCITMYSRSVRREKLENRWAAEPVEGMTREDYIAKGMAEYEGGLRKQLILLVFVIPPVVAGIIIYFIN